MGGDEKGYKLDLAFARSTLQEVLVHVTDKATSAVTEVWGRNVQSPPAQITHETAETDGVLEKSLCNVRPNSRQPHGVGLFSNDSIVNYTGAGSQKVLNKPVVLCHAFCSPADRMVHLCACLSCFKLQVPLLIS